MWTKLEAWKPSRYELMLLIGCNWILMVAFSFVWNWHDLNRSFRVLAESEALTAWQQDMAYRRWTAAQGGVYVRVPGTVPPNPYLAHLPDRDITAMDGGEFTLVNPAYLARLVQEFDREEYEPLRRITSLRPLRPENAPDPWEAAAMRSFEQGTQEVVGVESFNGQHYLRLMRPLVTDKTCLQCHDEQGYREGDIRGGLAVSVPLAKYDAAAHRQLAMLALGHGLVGLIGVLGLSAANTRLRTLEGTLQERDAILSRSQQIAHVGSWTLDLGSERMVWSDELYRILGFEPQEFAPTYQALLDAAHPDDRAAADAACSSSLLTDEGGYEIEYRVVCKSTGQIRHVHHRCVHQRNRAGKTVHFVGTIEDVTERKQAELELWKLVEEKTVLLKEVHHRVKNNLQVIVSLLSLQAGGIKSPEIQAALRDTQNRVRSMALLHETLYRSSNLASVRLPGYLEALCAHLWRSAGHNAERILLERCVGDVSLGLDQAVPCGLVVNELITNALKHAFPDGRAGKIRLSMDVESDGRVTLSVADDGVGLQPGWTPEEAENLGLRLVFLLAEQLDGAVQIHRRNGTEFRITFRPLPVAANVPVTTRPSACPT